MMMDSAASGPVVCVKWAVDGLVPEPLPFDTSTTWQDFLDGDTGGVSSSFFGSSSPLRRAVGWIISPPGRPAGPPQGSLSRRRIPSEDSHVDRYRQESHGYHGCPTHGPAIKPRIPRKRAAMALGTMASSSHLDKHSHSVRHSQAAGHGRTAIFSHTANVLALGYCLGLLQLRHSHLANSWPHYG